MNTLQSMRPEEAGETKKCDGCDIVNVVRSAIRSCEAPDPEKSAQKSEEAAARPIRPGRKVLDPLTPVCDMHLMNEDCSASVDFACGHV